MQARTLALASSFIAIALAAVPTGAAAKVAVRDGAVPGYKAPGSPAKYNRVFVRKYGPSDAKKVLVLVPGTLAGASTFDIVAPQLVEQVPSLQVWAQDRRESALEDPSMLAKVRAGTATPAQARDYYLGWLANPAITPHYQPLTNAQTAFGKTWGLRVALEDLRRIVLRASDGGKRTVVLGGHSLGGGIATLYATWDFHGTPGYRDIDGIVGIDGGMSRSGGAITLAQAKAQLAELDTKGPWMDLLGLGLPWVAGAFGEVAAAAAYTDPKGASVFDGFPLLPAQFKPPVPATNQGGLGFAFDRKTSPAALSLIHVRSGSLSPTGPLHDWVDDGITPIRNLATAFSNPKLTAESWYFPSRLSLDARAARSQPGPAVSKLLGLRSTHLRDVDIPYFAFQAELSGREDGLAKGARDFKKRSKIPSVKIVDRKATYSHLDPLLAAAGKNELVSTLGPWLRAITPRGK
ncbi:MAG: hypothetical protein JHC95_21995 [Solirubrobacteraceae bacterium]|nr:hypothetical protein [Solirubrobacteraceae bacterium]